MRVHKILYFSSFGTMKGGGQKSLLLTLRHLDRKRFLPECVTPTEGDFAEALKMERIENFILPMERIKSLNLVRTLRTIFRTYRLIRAEGVSLVHTDGPRNTFYAGMAAKLAGIPLVFHVRVEDAPRPEDRLLAFLTDGFIFVSNAARRRFYWVWDHSSVKVIYNGIDVHELESLASQPHSAQMSPHPNPSFSVGCIGRVEECKGQMYLVQAIPRIIKAAGDTTFYFIGEQDEAYMKRLRDLRAPLDKHILFTGFMKNPYPLMRQMDLIVLPTLSEGFSRVILESMAMGKPVVATSAGGNPEAVVEGNTGYLVPLGNADALSEKIILLLKDKIRREEMGNAGFRRVQRFFDIKRIVREIEDVYSNLLGPA